jgi:hypothetical protein
MTGLICINSIDDEPAGGAMTKSTHSVGPMFMPIEL